jgi:hypothetical protein
VPHLTYQRVFGSVMQGQSGTGDMEALRRARMLRKSVLDFSLRDLGKLRTLAPKSEHERLDAHEQAVRAVEKELDAADTRDPDACAKPMMPPVLTPFSDSQANRIGNGNYSTVNGRASDEMLHEQIGKLHFEVIKAAFQCDLTRVVTFQWSPGTNHVSFKGMYPNEPDSIKMHHPLSHEFNNPQAPEFLTKVDTWYSQRTAGFLQALLETKDLAGGSLLDNTLVPYVTEVARADHSFQNAPFLVFGGKGVKLQGDRLKKYNPRRPVNDMWLACAQALDVPMTALGGADMHTKPLEILI